jgi:hypothetical protein
MDDYWFGGRTKNPWKMLEGSVALLQVQQQRRLPAGSLCYWNGNLWIYNFSVNRLRATGFTPNIWSNQQEWSNGAVLEP